MEKRKLTFLKFIVSELIKRKFFSLDELYNFFLKKGYDFNKDELRNYLFRLKKKNEIYEFLEGYFTFEFNKVFEPKESSFFNTVCHKIKKQYPELDFVIWETGWIIEFLNMVSFKNVIIIEVEKYAVNSMFEFLKIKFPNKVFLNPDKNIILNYANDFNEYIVVKSKISKSPVQKYKNFLIPKLEKILVDLFNDDELHYYYRGNELENVYSGILREYNINYSTLLNYAKRRGKLKEFNKFLNSNLEKNKISNDIRKVIFERMD
ncbi:MAG: hypothetical protein IAE65_05605 [Ignavibacteria bacterium]|nr:hypothetical protein [Ignavibacteria bacterium]HCN37804.1 hypothetical protein [Bacteroidota bacterium]